MYGRRRGILTDNMQMLNKLAGLIAKHRLERIKSNILRSVKPSVELRLADPRQSLVPGQSHLGGVPDLPSPELWPTYGRTALSFIGQIRLEDLRPHPAASELPPRGLLSFFYDIDGWPSGDDTSRRVGWKVLYFEDCDRVVTVSEPGRGVVPVTLPSFTVLFVSSLTLPALRSIEMDPLELADDERARYRNLREEALLLVTDNPNMPLHRVLGHPDAIQGCMQRTVQFASHDEHLPHGVYSYYEHPRAAELIPGAFDWRLLLQIDSDERLGVTWGDAGRIYFWVHKNDLIARDFSKVWLFLQCY
jgi:uncharacterized protein YwqG